VRKAVFQLFGKRAESWGKKGNFVTLKTVVDDDWHGPVCKKNRRDELGLKGERGGRGSIKVPGFPDDGESRSFCD